MQDVKTTGTPSASGEVTVHQILLTRFNINRAKVHFLKKQSDRWLEERIELFERYCAPSIVSQTQEDFDWVIFCDPGTAPELLARIRSADSRIRIAFYSEPRDVGELPEGVVAVVDHLNIHPFVRPGTDVVVGTRIDNDDVFSRHALKRVRDLVPQFLKLGHERWLYNPQLGFKLDQVNKQLYFVVKRRPNSPFITLFEKVKARTRPLGPLSHDHSTIDQLYPWFQDAQRPLWITVVHGGNVTSSLDARDPKVGMEELRDDFLFRRDDDGGDRDAGQRGDEAPAVAQPAPAKLIDLGAEYETDKLTHDYLGHYDVLFEPIRNASFDLLEIGVSKGASIRMWHDYFPNARILGLDVKPDPGLHDLERYTHVEGSQIDWTLLNRLGTNYNLRLIIDDGSHLWGHQIFTFQTLFPWLEKGGIYVCESIQTGFGPDAQKFQKGAPESAAQYFLRLAEMLAAGEFSPLRENANPLLYQILTKIRKISFIRDAAIIQA
jgi:hypothetical protein